MKHAKPRETVTAVLFLLLLAAGCIYALYPFFTGVFDFRAALGQLRRGELTVETFLDEAEEDLNSDLDRSHGFIQLYGGIQKLLGRQVLSDVDPTNTVVRLSDGSLQFVDMTRTGPKDTVEANAQAAIGLRDALEAENIPFLYVMAPQKIGPGLEEDLLPTGIPDYGNGYADAFLSTLKDANVDTVDLRTVLAQSDTPWTQWFFRTDHHWKPEAAFFCYQSLVQTLETYGIYTDPMYTDEANWEKTIYEDYFLGSQGKRVGSLYTGVDDFTAYSPKFPTDMGYTCDFYDIHRSGAMTQSVLFPERLETKDWFNANPYTYYAGGDYPLATVENYRNPDGKSVVLIRESFSCAITPFLALSCSTLNTIDLRYFSGDLVDTITNLHPDLVIMLYGTTSTANETLFTFE